MTASFLRIGATMLLGALIVGQGSAQEKKTIRGTYVVYAGDKRTQTDAYEIASGMRVVDEIKNVATGEERTIELKMTGGAAVSYNQTLNGKPDLNAVVEGNVISFRQAEAMIGAVPFEEKAFIFDPAAFAEYSLLVQRYDQAKGGKQAFDVVVPSLQDMVRVELERHGGDKISVAGSSTEAAHYRVAIGKKETANLWSVQGRVVGLYLASKGLLAIDGEDVQLKDQIKRLVNKPM